MGEAFAFIIRLHNKLVKVVVAMVVLAVTFIDAILTVLLQLTEWAADQIASAVGPEFVLTLSDAGGVLSLANHFFPVAEMWAMIVITLPLPYLFFILGLRFVKQFIPTISN